MSSPASAIFNARTALVLVLVGVFSFAAFVVLSTYAPELRSGRDGRAHALSRSAVGYAGLVQLARDSGLQVEVLRGRPRQGALLVLTPELGIDPEAFREAIAQKQDAPTLVVLPKWQVSPDPLHPGWVSRGGRFDPGEVARLFPDDSRPPLKQDDRGGPVRVTAPTGAAFRTARAGIGSIDGLQTITDPRYDILLADDVGRGVLVSPPGRPDLVILADPDLLNTQGLADVARARLAVDILRGLGGGGPVEIDAAINGFAGSRSLLRLAFEPPFLAATLCAAAAAALMGWAAVARFGAPRPTARAFAFGKQALADNSAALLRMAKREHRMAAPYAALTLLAAAHAVGVPRSLDKAEADAMLDRLALKAGAAQTPSALAAEAAAVTDAPGLMRTARKLFDLRRLMTRETT